MKILLASKEKFLLEKGYSLLGISNKELKIGIVDTALKVVVDQEYLNYMKEYDELMESSGIDFKRIDIVGKSEKEIMDFFSDRNVVQVSGGNPFYLLKAVRETKFDLILKNLFKKGLCYIGCSSGTYLMCPTVEVGGWKLDRDRFGLTDLTALNYVPFLLKCHYKDEMKEDLVEKIKTLKYPLRILRDDQCFLIEDEKIEFWGNGEEVKLI